MSDRIRSFPEDEEEEETKGEQEKGKEGVAEGDSFFHLPVHFPSSSDPLTLPVCLSVSLELPEVVLLVQYEYYLSVCRVERREEEEDKE